MPLVAASAVITMTVGVAMNAMVTGIVMGNARTGMKDVMRGVRRKVKFHYINTLPALIYPLKLKQFICFSF